MSVDYRAGMDYWPIRIPGSSSGNRFFPGKNLWAKDEGVTLYDLDQWGDQHHPPVPVSGSVLAMLQQ